MKTEQELSDEFDELERRYLKTKEVAYDDVKDRLEEIADEIYRRFPATEKDA